MRTFDTEDDSPVELTTFRGEIDAIMLELSEQEPDVVHAGATAAGEVGDDVGLRENVVGSLASAAETALGGFAPGTAQEDAPPADGKAPVSDSAASGPASRMQHGWCKYPRVDPPEVEGAPGEAIREDTPG